MFDVIIKNGMIVDGTGNTAYKADIGICGDKITKIGDLQNETSKQLIDANNKYVTPGFIEPHSHCDLSVLFYKDFTNYLEQGVTTVVGGNCGHSYGPVGDELYRSAIVDSKVSFEAAPEYFSNVTLLLPKKAGAKALKHQYGIDMDWHSFGEYIDRCNKNGMAANIVPLVGYSAIRGTVMGMDCCREATTEELDKLEALTEKCMKEGAFGISTGTDPNYVPGPFATKEETVRMLKVVKKYNGIFASHTRNYDLKTGKPDRMGGYKDMLEEALEAGIRANVSHVHTLGMGTTAEENAQAARDTLAYFEEMEQKGLDLSYDVIPSPYSMDMTVPYFAAFLRPFVLLCGSREKLAEALRAQDVRKMIRTLASSGNYPVLDDNNIPTSIYPVLIIRKHKTRKEAIGKTFITYAKELNQQPLDVALDLFIEDPDMRADMALPDAGLSNEILCRHRLAMPCADGLSTSFDTNIGLNEDLAMLPNPMNMSCMIRWLTKHPKETFEKSIHQITGYVADRFNIKERGILKEGYYADITILDKNNLYSHDEEDNPLQYPEGIDYVLVNGSLTIDHKKQLPNVYAGKMLKHRI